MLLSLNLFPASKKLFCSLISSLPRLQDNFPYGRSKKFCPSIWAYWASSPLMNSLLILKFTLLRLFVLCTLHLHFLCSSSNTPKRFLFWVFTKLLLYYYLICLYFSFSDKRVLKILYPIFVHQCYLDFRPKKPL